MSERNTVLGVVFLRDVPMWKARPWLRRLALLAYVYLLILGLVLLLEDRILHPGWSFGSDWKPAQEGIGATDITLRSPDGKAIDARWFVPPGWKPSDGAILHSHGNGGNLTWRTGQALAWRKHFPMAMLMYDYPGYGRSEGQPTEATCYAAGEAAYAWLREKGVEGKKILLLGESLGGGIAIELATRHPCRGVVTVGTFTSIPEMAWTRFPWLPAHWLVRNKFDNLGKIGGLDVPVFIQHGTADGTVPFWQGERLAKAAPPGSRFHRVEGGGHHHPKDDAFFLAVKEWLEGR